MRFDIAILVLSAMTIAGAIAGSLWARLSQFKALYAGKRRALGVAKHVLEIEIDGETIQIDLNSPSASSNAKIDRAISLLQRAHHPA